MNNLEPTEARRAEMDRIFQKLAAAIDREVAAIVGKQNVRTFARTGEAGFAGEPTGVWATVEIPSARLLELSDKFIRGEVDRQRVVDAASAVLDAWKSGAREFASKQPQRPASSARR